MKIAFYSPLKSPNHPVPSGDRLMARLLISALERAGHEVHVVSELRAFLREPSMPEIADLFGKAEAEKERIAALWRVSGPPDVWFCYHLYYKAPDLIGPGLAREFGIAYLTAEASYSKRRNTGPSAEMQDRVLDAVRLADVNICLTERDRDGLAAAAPDARLTPLPPFIDPILMLERHPKPQPNRLITVAMMRPGDKMQSYVMLAEALTRLTHLPWTLSIVGDGPQAAEVRALFSRFEADRILWHGERTAAEIADLLSTSSLYLWPGCGEAFGLAYLEAQAAGLPVVAQAVAGVPSVVVHDRTGLLTPPDDVAAYAQAIERLLTDDGLRARLASGARVFAREERSIDRAAVRLADILDRYVKRA
ncbi:MAG TPA: glycosyltransferase family 4 protein [Pararhizobium sp.]|uniref:glycosyltransferase family 4 protein n=1 Tax=Pararhizobium sp. TaxID=1977563 RepID=UPI002BFF922A|nr:glycosyltransferase family 4 protein [Pararhizobium sp.]HTO31583.1 glycosyltransferase family 4 protein [Pararhizobium sp.]